MRKLFFAWMVLCCFHLPAVADPITIQISDWRFEMEAPGMVPFNMRFSMNGVGSNGKQFQFSGVGRGSIPGLQQANGSAIIDGFQFTFGDFFLTSTGFGSGTPVREPRITGEVIFMPLTPPIGGNPQTITSILSFTPPSGLTLLKAFGPDLPLMQIGNFAFSVSGAAQIIVPNSNFAAMVASGTSGTATLNLTPQAQVPEPSTLLCLGIGLASLAWRRRVKNRPGS